MAGKFNIFSLNIGMNDNLAGLVNYIRSENLDIIFLQEVRISTDQLQSKVEHFGYSAEANVNEDDPFKPGTAIVWKSSIPILNFSNLVQCRCQVTFLGRHILLNVYAHSGSEKKQERGDLFAKDIFYFMSLHNGFSFIFGGDFNSILSPSDVENGFGFQQKFFHQLSDLFQAKDLIDSFRYLNPAAKDYTFFRASATPSRFDRFYLSSDLLFSLHNVKHLPSLSDHCGVLLCLTLHGVDKVSRNVDKKSSSYWKLNASILKEEDFQENFSDLWKYLVGKKHEYSDAADWWDYLLKPSIKEVCIIYSKRRASRKKDTLKFWFAYFKVCLNDKDWKEVSRVKEVIKDLILEGASGHQMRSKAANAPEELVSLFHANMELKNAKKSSLSKLKSGDEIIEDGEVIEREILGFFKALFNGHHNSDLVNTGSSFMPDYSNLDVFLDRITSLPDDVRDTLTEKMKCEELRYIILKCSNNKSPGLDGLSYEFYKCTLDIIQDDL